nr:hypothetical protein L203_00055 [Cryptococcus depauperatus CBS 7841]
MGNHEQSGNFCEYLKEPSSSGSISAYTPTVAIRSIKTPHPHRAQLLALAILTTVCITTSPPVTLLDASPASGKSLKSNRKREQRAKFVCSRTERVLYGFKWLTQLQVGRMGQTFLTFNSLFLTKSSHRIFFFSSSSSSSSLPSSYHADTRTRVAVDLTSTLPFITPYSSSPVCGARKDQPDLALPTFFITLSHILIIAISQVLAA